MKETPTAGGMTLEQDHRISEAIEHHQPRLRNFIRKRVSDPGIVEDILQDAFFELVTAFRMVRPVEHIGPWLFRVIRNRIADFYRKSRQEVSTNEPLENDEDTGSVEFGDLLPSPEAGPDAVYARRVLLDELRDALAELPDEQREVFVAHELEGRSFKELSAETGVSLKTLLSRKHYAVLRLRERLQSTYHDLTKG